MFPLILDLLKDGNTALIEAALNGKEGRVRLLVEAGAERNIKNKNGKTALDVASTEPAKAILKLAGAKAAKSKYGAKPLLKAVEAGDLEAANDLLSVAEFVDLEERDDYGNTALILALDKGHDSTVQALLAAGANKDAQNHDGDTALIRAARYGHVRCFTLLVEAGADRHIKDKQGKTALDWTTQEFIESVKAILKLADAKAAKKKYGTKPLVEALKKRDLEAATALLGVSGFVDLEERDRYGRSALIHASRDGYDSIAEALLAAGANKDAKSGVSQC